MTDYCTAASTTDHCTADNTTFFVSVGDEVLEVTQAVASDLSGYGINVLEVVPLSADDMFPVDLNFPQLMSYADVTRTDGLAHEDSISHEDRHTNKDRIAHQDRSAHQDRIADQDRLARQDRLAHQTRPPRQTRPPKPILPQLRTRLYERPDVSPNVSPMQRRRPHGLQFAHIAKWMANVRPHRRPPCEPIMRGHGYYAPLMDKNADRCTDVPDEAQPRDSPVPPRLPRPPRRLGDDEHQHRARVYRETEQEWEELLLR
eukprot:gene5541-1189_t